LKDFNAYERKRWKALPEVKLGCLEDKCLSDKSFENFSGKYKTEFDESSIIGFGYFGIVCKAKTNSITSFML
jgi:hypothetical protein